MSILTLSGEPALRMASITNRAPEVAAVNGWATGTSQAAARLMLQHYGPTSVRLQASPRVLLEDILKRSIDMNTDLVEFIASVHTFVLTTDQVWALNTIKDNIA